MRTNYDKVHELDHAMRNEIYGIVKKHGKIVFIDGEDTPYECSVGFKDPDCGNFDDVVWLTYEEGHPLGRVIVLLDNGMSDRQRELDLNDGEFSTLDIADILDGCIKLTQNK